jgi:hypothetical protein
MAKARFHARYAKVARRYVAAIRFGASAAFGVALGLWGFGTTLLAQAQAGQSEYVPVKELPATEQLPAGPLVIAAYAAVWLIGMAYVWSVWRRLEKVEHDMRELGRRESQRARH